MATQFMTICAARPFWPELETEMRLRRADARLDQTVSAMVAAQQPAGGAAAGGDELDPRRALIELLFNEWANLSDLQRQQAPLRDYVNYGLNHQGQVYLTAAELQELETLARGRLTAGRVGQTDDPDLVALKRQWTGDAALRAEFDGDFQSYMAYTKHQAAGDVSIHGGKSAGKSAPRRLRTPPTAAAPAAEWRGNARTRAEFGGDEQAFIAFKKHDAAGEITICVGRAAGQQPGGADAAGAIRAARIASLVESYNVPQIFPSGKRLALREWLDTCLPADAPVTDAEWAALGLESEAPAASPAASPAQVTAARGAAADPFVAHTAARLAADWQSNPQLRREFQNDFGAYQAYKAHEQDVTILDSKRAG